MNMDRETVENIVVMYLSANEETKQEIRNVLIYLDSIYKPNHD